LLEAGVTAALAFDDVVAQGIVAGLAERNLSVPRDFSIVGCDGVIATTTFPPLTSIDVGCLSAGQRAVDVLMSMLRTPWRQGRESICRPNSSSGPVPERRQASPRREKTSMIAIHIESDKRALGHAAAACGAAAITAAIESRGQANIVVATGASQFETMAALVSHDTVDWSRVTAFHLDEYIDMPATHPASFRRYLKERFTAHLPKLGTFHFIEGDAPDLSTELARINALIAGHPIDVTFAGIGENTHLAFNDPPAEFDAPEAFKVVALDDLCRRQQFGEGWFASLDDVPREAISMTIPQIMKSRVIVLAVPDARKATAVRATLQGPISPQVPASILQQHPACELFLDPDSAALLGQPSETAGA